MHRQLIELSKHGHQLLKNRRYAEASQVFENKKLAPDDPYIMTGMGDALRQQKEFAAAAGYYRQVLGIDPYNPFALRGLGDALRGLHQYGDAIEFWKKYLQQKDYKDFFVLTRIADCYKNLDKYEDSHNYYQKALALEANDRYVLMGLADLYHKHGLELQAIEYYEKALSSGVTLIKILTIVGNLHYRHGNYEKARMYYEKTLAQDPHNSYALYGLGNYYRWEKDYRRAVELWEKILEMDDGTAILMTRLGDAYRNLCEYEAAERAYKSNLDKDYNMFSMVGMIKLLSLQGRMKEACDCYDELLRNEGEDRKIFAEVGEGLIQNNQHSQALHFFHHALQRQKENPAVSRIIGDLVRQLEAA